jgi:hypothetical protein
MPAEAEAAPPMPEALQPPTPATPIVIEENPLHTPRGIPEHLRKPVKSQAEASPRRSIFNIVTGAFRGASQSAVAPIAVPATPSTRVEPSLDEPIEPVRASVRPAGGEENLLDIPAFLRRQSS